MYEPTGQERLIPIEPALPVADAGAPAPRVIATEFDVAIAYWTADRDHRVAVAHFTGTNLYFGNPNDEALDGHPLYALGLEHYTFAEVLNSPWIAGMERRNRVHPDHKPERVSALRHFVLPFHDSTFECVASQLRASVTDASDPAAALMTVELRGD